MITERPVKGKNSTAKTFWSSGSAIHVSKDGKHELPLSPESPILLKRYRFLSDYHITPNYHDFFEISLICAGHGIFWSTGKKIPVKAGDVFIVGDNQFHGLEVDLSSPMTVYGIYFLPECIYKPGGNPIDLELIRPFFYPPVRLPNILAGKKGFSIEQVEELEALLVSCERFSLQSAKIQLSGMLLQIARHFHQSASGKEICHHRRYQDTLRLRPVFDFLQNHLSGEIDLAEVAHLACMSPSYFCRFFKRVTGTRLMEYLICLRIDTAKELLLKGDLSVSQVALETGFNHLSYFDRIFKKYTRFSPQEFTRLFSVSKPAISG